MPVFGSSLLEKILRKPCHLFIRMLISSLSKYLLSSINYTRWWKLFFTLFYFEFIPVLEVLISSLPPQYLFLLCSILSSLETNYSFSLKISSVSFRACVPVIIMCSVCTVAIPGCLFTQISVSSVTKEATSKPLQPASNPHNQHNSSF